MTEPIYIIVIGLFILLSAAFYVIVFALLLKISSRLQELLNQKPGRESAPAGKNGKYDKSLHQINRSLQDAKNEQDRARKKMRNDGDGQKSRGKFDKRRKPFQNDRSDRSDRSERNDRDDRNTRNDRGGRNDRNRNDRKRPNRPADRGPTGPKTSTPIAEVKSEPAPKSESPKDKNEIVHGRRAQIKRRNIPDEETKKEETRAAAPVTDAPAAAPAVEAPSPATEAKAETPVLNSEPITEVKTEAPPLEAAVSTASAALDAAPVEEKKPQETMDAVKAPEASV